MALKEKILFTTIPLSDREKKNLLFLGLIRKRKAISRTEISKLTGANIVTVSNYINGYLKKGLVIEGGYDISTGGRRPELVELKRDWGYVLGVDIGEKDIKGILADLGMKILADESIRGYKKENLKFCIEEILKKLTEGSKVDKTQIKKIGIGISENSGNVMEEVIKMKDAIEEKIKIPALIADGVLCAASGEKSLNPEAMEAPNVLYVYTDLGEAIFIKDDEFYEQATEGSPESNRRTDEGGDYAYLRPWDQSLSIVNEAKRIIEGGIGSKIVSLSKGDVKNVTMETVIEAAREHDEIAIDLLKVSAMNLAVRIAYLVNSFEPKVIIIGGGIEKAGKLFLEPLTSSINRFILQRILDKIKVTPAILEEAACVKGGASLAIREVFVEA
ncbi:MAG: ROK family protein [Candidatus Omnitrophota bacterium]|nr:MAG: ROK family protein [Candidatus Omnitrophota bacterium]